MGGGGGSEGILVRKICEMEVLPDRSAPELSNKINPDLSRKDHPAGRLLPSLELSVESVRHIFEVPRRTLCKAFAPGSAPSRRKRCCTLPVSIFQSA